MKWIQLHVRAIGVKSHPARGAWIEMVSSHLSRSPKAVAPREGCVD